MNKATGSLLGADGTAGGGSKTGEGNLHIMQIMRRSGQATPWPGWYGTGGLLTVNYWRGDDTGHRHKGEGVACA